MKENIGTIDRIARVLFAVIVGVLYFTGVISGTVAIILGVVAVVLLITGVVAVCPIYMGLKISTKKE